MSTQDIIRAWKDADYNASLSDAQRAALPDNPAGPSELTDADLAETAGGTPWTWGGVCSPGPWCISHIYC